MSTAHSLIESRSDKLHVVEPPVKSPVWIDGHSLRRQIENPFLNRILRRMFPDERRHPRLLFPPLVGYLGNAGSSKPFEIANVSAGGFCVRADEFWSPGTVWTFTLQRWDEFGDVAQETITVPAMVVRREEGAAGFAIAAASEETLFFAGFRVQQACNLHERMEHFLKRLTTPVAVPLVCAAADAPALHLLSREERRELLLERAKNHKLSQASDQEDGDGNDSALAG